LDEAIQDVGMISILEELQNPMLFGKRFEFCDDPDQLPVNKRIRLKDMPMETAQTS
jgi:hypothetical protein